MSGTTEAKVGCGEGNKAVYRKLDSSSRVEPLTLDVSRSGKICSVCNKVYRTADALQRHKKIHDFVTFFSCRSCGKRTVIRRDTSFHSLTHTGTGGPYICTCGAFFNSEQGLCAHIHSHVAGRTPMACICGESFPQQVVVKTLSDETGSKLKRGAGVSWRGITMTGLSGLFPKEKQDDWFSWICWIPQNSASWANMKNSKTLQLV